MANLQQLVDDLSALTVLEAAELSKLLEDKWGVSAAAPVAFAADPVSAAKVATQYAKDNDKFKVIGGILDQTTVLDQKAVSALATLPSLDQIRAQLIGLIQAPATKVAGVLQAPAAQLARVLNAYATKDAA